MEKAATFFMGGMMIHQTDEKSMASSQKKALGTGAPLATPARTSVDYAGGRQTSRGAYLETKRMSSWALRPT